MKWFAILALVLALALPSAARAACCRAEWVTVIAQAGRSVTLRHRDGFVEVARVAVPWPQGFGARGVCVVGAGFRDQRAQRLVEPVAPGLCAPGRRGGV